MILDYKSNPLHAKDHRVIDLDTGEEFARPYWYADDETGEVRCYRYHEGAGTCRSIMVGPDRLPLVITLRARIKIAPRFTRRMIRILSGSNPYEWEEVEQDDKGEWVATGPRSGVDGAGPAWDRNDRRDVAPRTVWLARLDGVRRTICF